MIIVAVNHAVKPMSQSFQYKIKRFRNGRILLFAFSLVCAMAATGSDCWPNAPARKPGYFLDRVLCAQKQVQGSAKQQRKQNRKDLVACLRRKESAMIARYNQLVQRSGDRLLLKLKYGNTLIRSNTKDENKELYDKLGKPFVTYYYYGFDTAHCYHVVATSYWETFYLQFVNTHTGKVTNLPGRLTYSPEGNYLFGYDDDPSAKNNLVLYRIDDKALTLVYGKSIPDAGKTLIEGRWESDRVLKLFTGKARLYAILSLKDGKWVLQQAAADVVRDANALKKDDAAAPQAQPATKLALAKTYKNLGLAFEAKGRLDKALEYYHKALDIDLKNLGADHFSVARDYNDLGAVYEAMENYDQALYYYHLALKIDRGQMGPGHLQVATDYTNLGSAHEGKEEYEKAISYYLKALAINLKSLGANHVVVASNYTNLGSAYEGKEEYNKAIEYYQIALRIDKAASGGSGLRVAADYDNLASAYESLGRIDKAIEYYQHALRLKTAKLGEGHVDLAVAYNNLGLAYEAKQDYDKALEYYRKALAIAQQKLGAQHSTTKTLQGRISEARQKSRVADGPSQ